MDSDKEKYKRLLLIDKSQLSLELMRQANRVALFGAKVENFEYELREAQEKLDIIYSDLFIKYTKQLESEEKRVTKDYTVGLIKKNKLYKKQRQKVSMLKRDLGVWKARYKGILTKTDMLQQYCFNYRKRLEEGSARDKAKIKDRLDRNR